MATVIDLAILLVTLGLAYALMSEGFFGATLLVLNILFSGLIAFNFYEPLAKALVEYIGGFADVVAMALILVISAVFLRLVTSLTAKRNVRFPGAVGTIGKIVAAAVGGALMMGIVLTAFEAAPVQSKLFGTVGADDKPPMGLSLDHRWLNVVRAASRVPFARYKPDTDPTAKAEPAHVFDPDQTWFQVHEKYRPYAVEEAPPAAAPTPAPAAK